jgi:hypothetical protein
MNKTLFIILFCGLSLVSKAQTASVEPSIYGIQTGFLGVWIHNESRLTNSIALRGELGLDTGIRNAIFYEETQYVFAPVLTLEPRWYYNLNKRLEKDRRIDGNSGNFISLKTSYHPDWFVISNYDNLRIVSDLSIVPTWGMRRNIGDHFNYETGFGIGYVHYFAKNAGYIEDDGEVAVNLHLRIGYRF